VKLGARPGSSERKNLVVKTGRAPLRLRVRTAASTYRPELATRKAEDDVGRRPGSAGISAPPSPGDQNQAQVRPERSTHWSRAGITVLHRPPGCSLEDG
jgi:hypothetical protein